MAVSAANDASLMTVSVAPHRFRPERVLSAKHFERPLRAAQSVCVCPHRIWPFSSMLHTWTTIAVDIIAESALRGLPRIGKVLIVTDGDTHFPRDISTG